MPSDPLAKPEEAIRQLYAYVAYRVGAGPDAEDIVADALERALRYRDSYDSSRGSGIAWLIGIARRCIADGASDRGRFVELEESLVGADLVDVAEDAARRVDLQRALGCLDDRGRDLIALRYGAGLSSREIGGLLEMRANAVDVALHRALRELHTALAQP